MVSGSDHGRTLGALCLLGANVELPAVVLHVGCVDGVRASRLAALGVQRLEDRRALANGVVLLALLLNRSHPRFHEIRVISKQCMLLDRQLHSATPTTRPSTGKQKSRFADLRELVFAPTNRQRAEDRDSVEN